VAAAMDTCKLENGPGGPAEMVPGKMHCKMNMYLAVCRLEGDKTRYEVISKAAMVDPKEC
jgi:urea transport system substrate-binding protein